MTKTASLPTRCKHCGCATLVEDWKGSGPNNMHCFDCKKLHVEPKLNTIIVSIYGHPCECRLLKRHPAGTIDVERISDGKCFRVSGLSLN